VGGWKRDHGTPYTSTKGQTLDTAKGPPTGYRASPRPYPGTYPLVTEYQRSSERRIFSVLGEGSTFIAVASRRLQRRYASRASDFLPKRW
jgi:hypothetical protein